MARVIRFKQKRISTKDRRQHLGPHVLLWAFPIALAVWYIAMVNSSVGASFTLSQLEEEVRTMRQDVERIDQQHAAQKSISQIEETARAQGFVASHPSSFILVPAENASVAGTQALYTP